MLRSVQRSTRYMVRPGAPPTLAQRWKGDRAFGTRDLAAIAQTVDTPVRARPGVVLQASEGPRRGAGCRDRGEWRTRRKEKEAVDVPGHLVRSDKGQSRTARCSVAARSVLRWSCDDRACAKLRCEHHGSSSMAHELLTAPTGQANSARGTRRARTCATATPRRFAKLTASCAAGQ